LHCHQESLLPQAFLPAALLRLGGNRRSKFTPP
jgi:hypothetical protein